MLGNVGSGEHLLTPGFRSRQRRRISTQMEKSQCRKFHCCFHINLHFNRHNVMLDFKLVLLVMNQHPAVSEAVNEASGSHIITNMLVMFDPHCSAMGEDNISPF